MPWGQCSPPLPSSPVAPVTHIPPYAPVDWLHEEGREEATQVHHQGDGGDELLWRERQWWSRGASQQGTHLPTPPHPPTTHLGQAERIGQVHCNIGLRQVHNESCGHVQHAYLWADQQGDKPGISGRPSALPPTSQGFRNKLRASIVLTQAGVQGGEGFCDW